MNQWEETAIQLLTKSLHSVPLELNELDWKSDLSPKKERLAQHLSAFANQANGGYLAFGFDNNGKSKPIEKTEMDAIVQKLGNIARNNLSQPIGISHAVVNYSGNPVLLVHIREHSDKPIHMRGSEVFESYTRSAGHWVFIHIYG